VRYPGRLAQAKLRLDRLHRDVATHSGRTVGDGQIDGRVGVGQLHQAVGVGGGAELDAVHRQQIVSGLDVQARLGKRAPVVAARIVARIDRRQPVAPRGRVEGEVDAEQGGVDGWRRIAIVAPADIGVGVTEFADHLSDQIVEVLARTQQRQQLAVAVVDGLPVLAVHHRREEQVSLQAPRVVEHLGPFGHRIDQHAHVVEIELLLGLVILGGVDLGIQNGIVLFVLDQHPLAVE